jgi:hypothetical protein
MPERPAIHDEKRERERERERQRERLIYRGNALETQYLI